MEADSTQKSAAKIYKSLKESFYTGHSGGTVTEINLVTSIAPVAYILYALLQSRYGLYTADDYSLPLFLVDFTLNVLGLLLSITSYANHALMFNTLLLGGCAVLYFQQSYVPSHKWRKPPSTSKKNVEKGVKDDKSSVANSVEAYLPKKAFITAWRGGMMVVTCIAILAVDFRVFPRRFAKVETWGTSLMDLGVGSFVFANGVATSRAILRDEYLGKTASLPTRLYRSLRSSLALLTMGIMRLALTRGVSYHEHISEYGIHWNFFITLGLLPPFTALFQSLFGMLRSYEILSIFTAALYELVLVNFDVQKWVLLAERKDLVTANKEGIASFFGYLAIFLAGQATGIRILPSKLPGPPPSSSDSGTSGSEERQIRHPASNIISSLLAQSILWTLLYQFSISYKYGLNLQVSRRLANLPYFAWVSAYNTWQLLAFYLTERFIFGDAEASLSSESEDSSSGVGGKITGATYEERSPRIFRAFNRNGLIIFLVANLLTGLINISIDTLEVKNLLALGILVAYSLVLGGLAVGLDLKGITLKL